MTIYNINDKKEIRKVFDQVIIKIAIVFFNDRRSQRTLEKQTTNDELMDENQKQQVLQAFIEKNT